MNPSTNMPTESKQPKPKRSSLILWLMILIILGPMLFAWVLFLKGNVQQLRLSHHGDLISPPINISSMTLYDANKHLPFSGKTLKGKWWLVYVGPDQCYQECQNTLYNMRQLRVALGKNASRLERLFIPHPQCPINICEHYLNEFYPDMLRAKIAMKDFENLFGAMSNRVDRAMIGELYIIDPSGNIMMHYAADTDATAILSDIKRLLKVSKIG